MPNFVEGPAMTELPARAGIGLRPPHYRELLADPPDLGFVEVHSENYFGDGGQPLAMLERFRARYPVSLHGVGLSLGSAGALDGEHLERLQRLVRRIEPVFVSDHLCWGAAGIRHLNDLVPLPYTEEALDVVCRHVDEVQQHLQRRLLVENVSSYLRWRDDTLPEWTFLVEVAKRTGCGLLLDVNNVWVSAANHGFDPVGYIDAVPAEAVAEMHLAGFDEAGGLLIDTHGRRVAPPVWALYAHAVDRIGPRPTLIEWDTDLPSVEVLLDEARRANAVMEHGDAVAA
jgi:uncharacterized protein (UPF0276 family)